MESSVSSFANKQYPVYAAPVYTSDAERPMAVRSDLTVVHRGFDALTVVQTKALSESAKAINAEATDRPGMPDHTPDNAGAILIFHTEDGDFALSSVRTAPRAADLKTKRGTSLPKQVNAAIGGPIVDPALPLKESVMAAIKDRLLLNTEASQDEQELQARGLLNDLCRTIESDEGWEDKVCVQAGKWTTPDKSEERMCYLTGVKHIRCKSLDLVRIEEALGTVEAIQSDKGNAEEVSAKLIENLCAGSDKSSPKRVAPKAGFELEFISFDSIIENARDSDSEDESAPIALNEFSAITLNNLTVATLVKCDAFQHAQYADLVLPSYGATCVDFESTVHQPYKADARTHAEPADSQRYVSVARRLERIRKQNELQLKFKNLVKETITAIHRTSDEFQRKLVVDYFIVACHEYLADTDDQAFRDLILEKGQEILNQIEPTYRSLPAFTLNRLRLNNS